MRAKKEGKNKKIQHLGGEAFESMISYDITKKYFIEDFNQIGKDLNLNLDFCHNQDLDIEKMKIDILARLSPNENNGLELNKKKLKVLNEFCDNLNEFYQLKDTYNKIYISSDSYSSGYSSGYSSHNDEYRINNSKENKKKEITKLEFDLFLKNVNGKKIIKFLDDMKKKNRLIVFTEKKNLEEKKYNICIEITVNSADIISKKIPQLYKTISCMNFLYKTNDDFSKKSDISDSYGYFKNKTDFINYELDLIIMTISNGEFQIFRKIADEIISSRKAITDSPINRLDNLNNNYNIYMIYYPKYGDEEIEILNSKIEKLTRANEEQQKANEEQQKANEEQQKANEKEMNKLKKENEEQKKQMKVLEAKIGYLMETIQNSSKVEKSKNTDKNS